MAWLLDQGHHLARAERNPFRNTLPMRVIATAFELPARSLKEYPKPKYEVWEEPAFRRSSQLLAGRRAR
jgi:hypothetical protein